MGLDMYVFRTKTDIPPVDFQEPEDCKLGNWSNYESYEKDLERIKVCYWRKHPNLHGWFKNLYESKGGNSTQGFNGDTVRIDEADLDKLQEDIIAEKLPHTEGFFFGVSYGDADERDYDLKFVTRAKKDIKEGYKLYYTSSW